MFLLLYAFLQWHFILDLDSSKHLNFYCISVIDDQGGEVCDSHFPLQYSHPVSKI